MITPSKLPAPAALKTLMKSLAALDATLSPEWDYRYYSYDCQWSEGEEMGSIRNGSGDTIFVLFNSAGCFVKGYAHEYSNEDMSSDAFYDGVPAPFLVAAKEPAFSPGNVSFCAWRQNAGETWHSAVSDERFDDGRYFLLDGLDGDPKTYQAFTSDYFEMETSLEVITKIYQHVPMTTKMAKALNPDIDYAVLQMQLQAIGYPIATPPKSAGFLGKLFGR